MAYDPNEHKPPTPYDEGDNPDPESDDDVLENLSAWGIDGDEESELNLADKIQQQSTIDNSPPPETGEVDLEETSESEEDEDDDTLVPWSSLENEEVAGMMDETVE